MSNRVDEQEEWARQMPKQSFSNFAANADFEMSELDQLILYQSVMGSASMMRMRDEMQKGGAHGNVVLSRLRPLPLKQFEAREKRQRWAKRRLMKEWLKKQAEEKEKRKQSDVSSSSKDGKDELCESETDQKEQKEQDEKEQEASSWDALETEKRFALFQADQKKQALEKKTQAKNKKKQDRLKVKQEKEKRRKEKQKQKEKERKKFSLFLSLNFMSPCLDARDGFRSFSVFYRNVPRWSFLDKTSLETDLSHKH